MATVHSAGDYLVLCASSQIYALKISEDELFIGGKVDVNEDQGSLSLLKETLKDQEQEQDSKEIGDAHVEILCSTVSRCESLLAVATSAKTVLILNLPSLKVQRCFRIPKAPTSITFDQDDSHVVVGDRAGHVCRYTVATTNTSGYTDMNGDWCSCEGEPLLGTISMVLDVAISEDGRYLLVADRDEKIRISRYPEAYAIQSFCLGHSAYVSTIALHGGRLFSSGGDSVVHEWDMERGTCLARSERVSENPVRRMCICETENKVCIAAIAGTLLTVLDDKLKVVNKFSSSDPLMDITSHKGNIIGVSNSSVLVFNLSDGSSRSAHVPTELLRSLSMSRDPIPSYFKNVTHQNMFEYFKRKEEKMESVKENKIRKRKARQSRKAAAKMKKITNETEVAVAS
uniref:tRNA (guanine-N(7)-)-methyltransferase non-catalytic subunit n=1 Tax=Haemonchus contortus TaxID=6289 RepID=A0A7I5E956_HAECO